VWVVVGSTDLHECAVPNAKALLADRVVNSLASAELTDHYRQPLEGGRERLLRDAIFWSTHWSAGDGTSAGCQLAQRAIAV
jgi:hypothetical protein